MVNDEKSSDAMNNQQSSDAMVKEQSSGPMKPLPRVFYLNLMEKSIQTCPQISFNDSDRYIDEDIKSNLIQSTATRLRFSNQLKDDPSISLVSNQRILLVGPKGSEIHHQLYLIRCLANHFSSDLLVLEKGLIFYGGFSVSYDEQCHLEFADEFRERNLLFELHQVLDNHIKTGNPLILFLPPDVSWIFHRAYKHDLVHQNYMSFPSNVVIIGSSYQDSYCKPSTKPHDFFMHQVIIPTPQNKLKFDAWQKQLNNDAIESRRQANYEVLTFILILIDYTCTDLDKVSFTDKLLTFEDAALVIGWALSSHFTHMDDDLNEGDQKSISAESIKDALDLFRKAEHLNSIESIKSIRVQDAFEISLLNTIMMRKDMAVFFEDIGGLDEVKGVLTDFVILPLKRPGLCKSDLMSCNGILLYGPPGTGKTMLVKAVAAEAGINLMNISSSTFVSFAAAEKTKAVKALFTLATKIAPCVIFLDEVETMLGKRGVSDEGMKNEFMMNWDVLSTKGEGCVIVLAATNRPFDLDESVIRRFTRRLMLNLPDAINREKILRVVLREEEIASDVNLEVVAEMTKGYSSSDLKNLCVVAAHCRIRELRERSLASEGGTDVRALKMADFTFACETVSASLSADSSKTNELVLWNVLFGEGSKSRKDGSLGYFM